MEPSSPAAAVRTKVGAGSGFVGLAQRHPLASYLLLAYGLSWLAALAFVPPTRTWLGIRIPHALEFLVALGPAVAAFIVVGLREGRAGLDVFAWRLLDWRFSRLTFAMAIAAPVLMFAAALVASRYLEGSWPALRADMTAGTLFLAVAAAAMSGPGEEPGWRGFALPRLLQGRSALRATLLLWLLWAPWHLPMLLYEGSFDPSRAIAFFLALLFGAIWLTSLYNLSGGSITACIAWHAVWNIVATAARALEPSPFPWMGAMVLVGALAIVMVWRPARLAPARR